MMIRGREIGERGDERKAYERIKDKHVSACVHGSGNTETVNMSKLDRFTGEDIGIGIFLMKRDSYGKKRIDRLVWT